MGAAFQLATPDRSKLVSVGGGILYIGVPATGTDADGYSRQSLPAEQSVGWKPKHGASSGPDGVSTARRAIWPRAVLLALWVLGLLVSVPAAGQEQPSLEYHRHSLKLAQPDATPQLRIYPSGRVESYYPHVSPKAGRYALQMSANELAGLWASLRAGGLFELTDERLRKDHRAAEQTRRQREGTLYYSSDATVTSLRVRLDGEPELLLEFTNLQAEASRLPQAALLNRLAAIERRLWKLRDDPRMQRFASPDEAPGR